MSKEKIIIDLNDPLLLKEGVVYTRFRNKVNDLLLDLMQAGIHLPFSVRGTTTQVDSFMAALSGEKSYMNSYIKHGLNDPKTLNHRHRLEGSVGKFEKETGLKWPFKN